MLNKHDPKINHQKTEEYKIKRAEDDTWKECRYLGTQLHTEADMKRRKYLNEQNKIHNKRQKAQTLNQHPNPSEQ